MCNGYECYYIKNFNSQSITEGENGNRIYINKENGLPVRIVNYGVYSDGKTRDQIIDYTYEFNKVTDRNVEAPDLSQYQVEK